MFAIASAQDMENALEKMSEDQREHLRLVISTLVQCYIDDDTHGMLLVGQTDKRPMKIMSINATDMEAATLLQNAHDFINYSVMEDAPPKEKFN